eukprot:s1780_g18.t1
MAEKDRMGIAKLLVERNVCNWVELESVLKFRGERVLNGLFGVAKSTLLPDSRPCLRVIMNLIPSNAVMVQLRGMVDDLPGITQYLSLVLEDGEKLQLAQSDMVSAFYLFSLPCEWQRYLAFNLVCNGKEIDRDPNCEYALACAVLPMGWASAVSVMQEVSQNLLSHSRLPDSSRVSRLRPLPSWLTQVLGESICANREWYHVYLDNFFCGERLGVGETGGDAAKMHEEAEKCWAEAGVLSSEKKRVSGTSKVQELGALMDGEQRMLGVSGERLVKLLQTTSLLLSKRSIPRKWLQVVLGRWVHVLQFRRAGMAIMQGVWRWIGNKKMSVKQMIAARRELCVLMFGCCLFHTYLGSSVSGTATASDASGRGGAVGRSDALSPEGQDFCRALTRCKEVTIKVPVLVISLFNGVGEALRAYDLVGVEVAAFITYDISKPANRVVSRRWPHAVVKEDVKSIDRKTVYEWLLSYPHVELIDLWGGFPCVDLSAVKAFRRNLAGDQSGLFTEILRVLELLYQVFGRKFPIRFFVENVSSMDRDAAEEISQALGVKPYKLQCSEAVPISRPRFCWTNKKLPNLPGVRLVDKGHFVEVQAVAEYPKVGQWLREDSWWEPETSETVFPTCMKAIKRERPPPAPAGLARTPQDARDRWSADEFRYPPARARRNVVLRGVGITKKTQVRYYNAVSLLCKTVTDAATMEALDDQISDWVEEQFKRGAPLNVVADALSGLHYFVPSTRRRLPASWKLYGYWRKMEVPSRAPPLPEDLWWALMSRAVQMGHFELASLLALGFHCFLRTGELLSLRPMDLLGPRQGIVTLPFSKGGSRHNIQESVTITDSKVLILLQEMVFLKKSQRRYRTAIWGRSGSAFRKELNALFTYFGVQDLGFRGYSLRRGGATAYFAKSGLMEKTLIRGRWASVAVAKLYLCDALAQLPHLVSSAKTRALVSEYRAFWSAKNHSVRSGVVIRDASPMLKGELPQYEQAARMAAETYGINVPENPVFIRWNDTPEANRMWFINQLLVFSLLAPIFLSLLICTGASLFGMEASAQFHPEKLDLISFSFDWTPRAYPGYLRQDLLNSRSFWTGEVIEDYIFHAAWCGI